MNTFRGDRQAACRGDAGARAGRHGRGLGFQYAVIDETGNHDLAQLRSLQDWTLKYAVESVPGVSQVASVGGFVKQYQITIDPNRMHTYNLSIMKIMEAVRRSNRDVEGRVIEWSGREYMVRGRGYIKDKRDIEKIAVGTDGKGTPIMLRDVAAVQLGPEIRRGMADLDGKGRPSAASSWFASARTCSLSSSA